MLHLSAPDGHSVNDHINKEDFTVHYFSVDDAVALLSQYGQDALMAKIDFKAAFRLIPVQAADWVHLGICSNPTSHHLQLLLNRAMAHLLQPPMPLGSGATRVLPCFQVDTGPRHKKNYHTICSSPQPDPELQDHSGLCGSSLIPAPLHGVLEPRFQ